jgi:hypothetical protein
LNASRFFQGVATSAADQPPFSSSNSTDHAAGAAAAAIQQHPAVTVGPHLAAELLVLTADVFAAAVCWWGAASFSMAYQQGTTMFGSHTASLFLTQQAQCCVQGSVANQQQQQEEEEQQLELEHNRSGAGSGGVSTGGSSSRDISIKDSNSSCTNEDDHNSSSSSSSGSSSAGSYAELLWVWQLLPRHVQRVLLQACSCTVVAAGQVLLDTRFPASTGTTGATAGCIGLAAGTALEVVPKSETGDVAAAVAAQHTVLPRASLTPRALGAAAAAAAAAAVIGRDADSNDTRPAMTPCTAATAAAAAGWQAVRAHVTSGSGASSSEVGLGSHPQLPGIAGLEHGDAAAKRAEANAKAEQHTSGSGSSGAAGSRKWDELSAAVAGAQRMKTAAFKALGWEVSTFNVTEQLCCPGKFSAQHIQACLTFFMLRLGICCWSVPQLRSVDSSALLLRCGFFLLILRWTLCR